MKIALYKDLRFDFISVTQAPDWLPEDKRESWERPGYVRISEWVEVEFPQLNTQEVIEAQLRQIDLAEQEVREKFLVKLEEFKGMRATLMALPNLSAEPA